MVLELLVISAVIILVLIYGIRIVRKKMRKKRFSSFNTKITEIFSKDKKFEQKLEDAKDYCRNTKGEHAGGAYIALDEVARIYKKR